VSGQVPPADGMFSHVPADVDGFDLLAELALDMRWSWNQAADQLWRQLDSELGQHTHNPWVLLQTVSRERLRHAWVDGQFRDKVGTLVRARREVLDAPAWFQRSHPQSTLTRVAHTEDTTADRLYAALGSVLRWRCDFRSRPATFCGSDDTVGALAHRRSATARLACAAAAAALRDPGLSGPDLFSETS
jgi:hypothetical protein